MQKTLTTLVLFLMCSAASSIAYYYIKYLPRLHDAELAEQRRKTDLENAQRCNKDASTFYSVARKRDAAPGETWEDPPEVHFNRTLNACLVEITQSQWLTIAGVGLEEFKYQTVWDIYSNHEIIGTQYSVGESGEKPEGLTQFPLGVDHQKHSAERDKLFSE
jgi:hypothetical protein